MGGTIMEDLHDYRDVFIDINSVVSGIDGYASVLLSHFSAYLYEIRRINTLGEAISDVT